MNWLEILGIIFLVFMGLAVVSPVVFWAKELIENQREILSSVQDKKSEGEEPKEEGDENGEETR